MTRATRGLDERLYDYLLAHEPPEPGETVVVVITGHGLKDPASAETHAPAPVHVAADPDAIAEAAAG
jgi:threonine synthase